MPGLFEYLTSINATKEYLMTDAQAEREYVPFMINRGLSQFHDTCLYANEINMREMPKRWAYEFYINSIPKKKRFSKWAKAEKVSDELKMLSEYFGCSYAKSKRMLSILTAEQLSEIKQASDVGGTS